MPGKTGEKSGILAAGRGWERRGRGALLPALVGEWGCSRGVISSFARAPLLSERKVSKPPLQKNN